tara:strand:+ start:86 stop:646 length:561 start_codon:yes stop_codon:yes gene_type:complete
MKNHPVSKIFILGFILMISHSISLANYRINESKLELLFSQSEDLSKLITNKFSDKELLFQNSLKQSDENGPKYKVAAGIAIATALLPVGIYGSWIFLTAITGGFGIILLPSALILAGAVGSPWYRYYLGTGDNSFKIGALYCITLNGLGWLTIADAVALLAANKDHNSYINNSKFLMWMDDLKQID